MFEMSRGGGGIFTLSQWEELQNQALIFKYLLSGHQVPPQLLVPIHNSRFYFDSSSSYSSAASPSNFFLSSATTPATVEGYYASTGYYGKKMDPEPGRCRRTDGKKWRCAKDAFPDSKYCERHMRKRKNNNAAAGSRKPVEIPTSPSSAPKISTSTSLSGGSGSVTTANNGGSFFPRLSMGNNRDQR